MCFDEIPLNFLKSFLENADNFINSIIELKAKAIPSSRN